MKKEKAVIVDIDGTVATRTNRDPYDYSKVLDDAVKPDVIEVVASLWRSGHTIIFVSARDDSCYDDTFEWLRLHCPPARKLFMRKTGDIRNDGVVKREIYEELIKPNWDVLCVLDDRQKVVDMWRSIGLTCLQVDYGDF
jgi:uncharacterized HAD superfamily protein